MTNYIYHLDHNDIERLNRYVSLSRRNSLFFGSHKGAERGAMFCPLVCSCRLYGVNFFEYINTFSWRRLPKTLTTLSLRTKVGDPPM